MDDIEARVRQRVITMRNKLDAATTKLATATAARQHLLARAELLSAQIAVLPTKIAFHAANLARVERKLVEYCEGMGIKL